MSIKKEFVKSIKQIQNNIIEALEKEDGAISFIEDVWERPGGGVGWTRTASLGNVFEKGGVNVSEVEGEVTPEMINALNLDGHFFYATGISLVLHPYNPFVPTIHANVRYFEMYDHRGDVVSEWFGGGMDLTPYYLFEEDVIHFHQTLKDMCSRFDTNLYYEFKDNCDQYFSNHHRNNESRGVGGIFFDKIKPSDIYPIDYWNQFTIQCMGSLIPSYLPIVKKRKNIPFDAKNKYWQQIRRGRYVEFNLIHDRGTLFGLKTNGRAESILMSLPPTVRFDYNYIPQPDSEEAKMLSVLQKPRSWV